MGLKKRIQSNDGHYRITRAAKNPDQKHHAPNLRHSFQQHRCNPLRTRYSCRKVGLQRHRAHVHHLLRKVQGHSLRSIYLLWKVTKSSCPHTLRKRLLWRNQSCLRWRQNIKCRDNQLLHPRPAQHRNSSQALCKLPFLQKSSHGKNASLRRLDQNLPHGDP